MNQRNKGSTLVEKKNKVEIKDVSFDCHNLKTILRIIKALIPMTVIFIFISQTCSLPKSFGAVLAQSMCC